MAFANKIGNLFKQVTSSSPSLYQSIRCMSSSKLFVGGISYNTDDQSLREAFSNYGEVVEARIIMDRETGRSRGFGFVTFTSTDEASSAVTGMDGKELHGRIVRVNYATDRTGGFRSGGGYGGGGYGGDGGYGSGGGGYGSGGGGYGSGGGGYGSGGGGGYGGSNYNSGGGGYGGGSYNSGGGDGYGGQDGGSNIGTGGEGYGAGGNAGAVGGYGASGGNAGAVGGYGASGGFPDDPSADFKDDDDTDGYASKRG